MADPHKLRPGQRVSVTYGGETVTGMFTGIIPAKAASSGAERYERIVVKQGNSVAYMPIVKGTTVKQIRRQQ